MLFVGSVGKSVIIVITLYAGIPSYRRRDVRIISLSLLRLELVILDPQVTKL